jgi:hypothetical protein
VVQALRPYHFQYPFDIRQYLIIPESQHRESLRIEPLCSFFVFFLFQSMLAAVRFHDDAFFKADEIGDEKAYLLLPPEFQTVELFGFQMAPQ